MIKFLKSNKIIILLILFICIIFILNPKIYSESVLSAISIWTLKVLPVLFPFFIFTRIIVSLSSFKAGRMDKYFNKLYRVPNFGFKIFLLSIISGYPMGAKLICTLNEQGKIKTKEAEKMMSFCSISGPMFIIGTVGVNIFLSYKAGLIILIANIISVLLNGLIYRKDKFVEKEQIYPGKKNDNILSDTVYDSTMSILLVCAYMVLSFLIIDVLLNVGLLNNIAKAICTIFNCPQNFGTIKSSIIGLFEITRGIIELNNTGISLTIKTIIASGLIGFGGISILMQSLSFLNKLKISTKTILKQKFTQGVICLLVTIPLALIFI